MKQVDDSFEEQKRNMESCVSVLIWAALIVGLVVYLFWCRMHPGG